MGVLRPHLLQTITLATSLAATSSSLAQEHGRSLPHTVTIPFLANQNNPSDLDFMAAQCDVRGDEMDCRFRQVFLTLSVMDAKSCAITTSGYEETFRRTSATRWVSAGLPEGLCGLTETATLDDGGGSRWTLTLRTTATRTEQPQCRTITENVEVYDWTNVKRALPCTLIQPGAIEK